MIRYYRLDINKMLQEGRETKEGSVMLEDALSVLNQQYAEIMSLFLMGSSSRRPIIRALKEKYSIKENRMHEINTAAKNQIRDYLEKEYPIADLYTWFTFDFAAFFNGRKDREKEEKYLYNERQYVLGPISPEDNMGIKGGKGDTCGMKIIKLEHISNLCALNKLCDVIATEIIEMATPFERDILDVFFLDRYRPNTSKSMGYKVELLAQRYNTNISDVYKVRRETLEKLDVWIKENYIYNENLSQINFAMSRKWNLINRGDTNI